MASDRLQSPDAPEIAINLIGTVDGHGDRYSTPIATEVAALLVGGMSVTASQFDIVVETISISVPWRCSRENVKSSQPLLHCAAGSFGRPETFFAFRNETHSIDQVLGACKSAAEQWPFRFKKKHLTEKWCQVFEMARQL